MLPLDNDTLIFRLNGKLVRREMLDIKFDLVFKIN